MFSAAGPDASGDGGEDEKARQHLTMDSRRNPSIATAIHLRWWRIGASLKAHEPLHQFEWSAADRAANNVSETAAPPASLHLYLDYICGRQDRSKD